MTKVMDLKGKKYGSWEVLKRNGTTKQGFAIWECQCKCGTIKDITSIGILHKKAKQHCGCDQDWIGKKFGRLTVLKKVSGLGNHAAKFLCLCECGKEKIVWGGSIHQGSTVSCGCLRGRPDEHICLTIVMSGYHRHAKTRKLEFSLTREEFRSMALSPCFYCGDEGSNMQKKKNKYQELMTLKYNGIDRVDNSKGYFIENCVSCCKLCNYMKREITYEKWKNHMQKILDNLDSGKHQQNQPALAGQGV